MSVTTRTYVVTPPRRVAEASWWERRMARWYRVRWYIEMLGYE